jgi:hypothetical protein
MLAACPWRRLPTTILFFAHGLDCESAWAAQEGGCEEDVVKDEEDEKDDMKDDVKDKSRTNILARPSVTLCDTLSSAVRNTTTTTIVLTRAIGNFDKRRQELGLIQSKRFAPQSTSQENNNHSSCDNR